MFYFRGDSWEVFKKRISYTETVEAYDDNADIYADKPDLNVEDIELTEEQLKRFETIRYTQAMGVEDVRKYVLEGIIVDENLEDMKKEVEAEKTREKMKNYIKWEDITPEQMKDLLENFREYKVGAYYEENDLFVYENQLYKVNKLESGEKGHFAQADWIPSIVPALYAPIAPPTEEGEPEIIAEWEQRYGHNQYEVGDKVLFEGQIWECVIANTYRPTEWAQGWKLVEE